MSSGLVWCPRMSERCSCSLRSDQAGPWSRDSETRSRHPRRPRHACGDWRPLSGSHGNWRSPMKWEAYHRPRFRSHTPELMPGISSCEGLKFTRLQLHPLVRRLAWVWLGLARPLRNVRFAHHAEATASDAAEATPKIANENIPPGPNGKASTQPAAAPQTSRGTCLIGDSVRASIGARHRSPTIIRTANAVPRQKPTTAPAMLVTGTQNE